MYCITTIKKQTGVFFTMEVDTIMGNDFNSFAEALDYCDKYNDWYQKEYDKRCLLSIFSDDEKPALFRELVIRKNIPNPDNFGLMVGLERDILSETLKKSYSDKPKFDGM